MAETKIETKLIAKNGVQAYFTHYGNPNDACKDGDCLFLTGSWPLDEYEELDKFVREHIGTDSSNDMKLSELEATIEPQTDG